MTKRHRFLTCLVALSLGALLRADGVDDLIRADIAKNHIPGEAVAVVWNGKVVKEEGYGFADLESKSRVTTATAFRIASMSKQFCASAVMLLADEGKLSLEDPVTKWLPDAPSSWSGIKLRHLLSHTSGIPDVPDNKFKYSHEYTPQEFFQLFGGLPLNSEPGAKFAYSNYGFATLGMVVKAASGESLRQFVSERIFKPLGMDHTEYIDPKRPAPNAAIGYVLRKDKNVPALTLRPQIFDGSGGIVTTLGDLEKWDAALRTDIPLKKSIRDQMWTRFTLNDGKKGAYGFGWFPKMENGKLHIYHGGATFGFTSHIDRFIDEGVTVILFRNGGGPDAQEMGSAIAALYLDRKK